MNNFAARTLVTFKANAFNTCVPKDYFINPTCFGDDVVEWMTEELKRAGFQIVGNAGQEDFGWFLRLRVGNTDYDFVVGFRTGEANDSSDWIAWIEPKRGIFKYLLPGREYPVETTVVHAIHAILSASTEIRDIRWHVRANFDKGIEELGSHQP